MADPAGGGRAPPPRLRVVAFVLAALALPLTLALVTYALTAPSFGATVGVTPEPASRQVAPVATTRPPVSTSAPGDPSGHCANPDHAAEPRCQPGGSGSDDGG